MFRWFWATKRSTQVQACRPVLEGLEGRRLMSATLLDTDAGAALEAASHGTGAGGGKVSMQDFHFVMRNNSASPTLFGTGGAGAGKVSMQDFHFVMRNNSASPTLLDTAPGTATEAAAHGSGGGAGKVSMQDFHFV